VWLVADPEMRSLRGIPRQIRAKNGEKGGTNNKTGKNGPDAIVRVPVGTVVSVAVQEPAADEPELQLRTRFPTRKLGELNEPQSKLLLAAGTAGGRGNASFVSSTNRSPSESTSGKEAQPVTALLELKLLVSLVLGSVLTI
jgi:GTP-binding protein